MTLREGKARDSEFFKEIAQRRHLFRLGCVVDPVHTGLPPSLKFFGGSDIGKHHEFLDQPMAVESHGRDDRNRPVLGVEYDAVLAKVSSATPSRASLSEVSRTPYSDATSSDGASDSASRCPSLTC